MRLSCGILIADGHDRLLLAHATQTTHWDIPKGGPQPGETPLQTALRETHEETGLDLAGREMVDLGEMAFSPNKRLHLFTLRVDERSIDLSCCVCTTYFSQPAETKGGDGHIPEVDDFAWAALEDFSLYCKPALLALLQQMHPHWTALPRPGQKLRVANNAFALALP